MLKKILRGRVKHKSTAVLLSISIVISSLIFSGNPVYCAERHTETYESPPNSNLVWWNGNTIYVSKSIYCPVSATKIWNHEYTEHCAIHYRAKDTDGIGDGNQIDYNGGTAGAYGEATVRDGGSYYYITIPVSALISDFSYFTFVRIQVPCHTWSGSTASCTSGGTRTCSGCGYSESTPALGHSWNYGGGSVYQNQSCTNAEYRYNVCTRCGAQSGTTLTKNALGHSENSGSVTTNPTCTTAGVKTFNCSQCGAYLRSTSIPASGHSWGSGNGSITQNQSCTLPEIRYNKCTRCTATNGTSQTKAALGHDWQTATLSLNNGIKLRPTVYSDGVFYQKCSRCSTGSSNDPYTNHFNVVPGTKDYFSIYVGESRVERIYYGEILIMDAAIGSSGLVESVV